MSLWLVGTIASAGLVAAQTDLNAFSGNTIADSQIDGAIGSEWNDAGKHSNTPINPSGTAEVWLKHDNVYFYVAIRFTADSNNPWVALMFAGNICMATGADGALFGNDEYSPDGYEDIFFGGIGVVNMDSKQDGKGAIKVDSSNAIAIELKKPLNSGDSSGRDTTWAIGGNYSIVIMWDSDGEGSSGGNTGHHGVMPTAVTNSRGVFLNPETIPEIPSTIIAGFLAIIIVVAVVFKAKRQH